LTGGSWGDAGVHTTWWKLAEYATPPVSAPSDPSPRGAAFGVKKIVGWAFAHTLETKLVLDALAMARAHRKPDAEKGLLHHSDCGSQYASVEYRKALNELKAKCSMSRKGNCWDNAVMESFFSTLKLELDLDKMIGDRAFTRTTVFSWIAGWYNRVRKHSSLGYVSPMEFEAKLLN
jgi:putative transposase